MNEAMGNAIARSGELENAVFHSDRITLYEAEEK